eukprot:35030-Ditylum_brightwellii.AAC.1
MGTLLFSDIFKKRVANRAADVKPHPPNAYIDDVLVAEQHSSDEHLVMMDEIFIRFGEAGLQANISKSVLFQKALEFFGFWLKPNGYRPLASRIQGIMDMDPPKDKRSVQTSNWM